MSLQDVAIVGAAETTEMGKLPDISQLQLHADAALNALADCPYQSVSLCQVLSIAHRNHGIVK